MQIHPIAIELGEIFDDAGVELALVGGSVRDLLLGREAYDLDFTTNATPDQVHALLSAYCDDLWDIGKEFGTIGGNKRYTDNSPSFQNEGAHEQLRRQDSPSFQEGVAPVGDGVVSRADSATQTVQIEVTTYRTDEYDPQTRKPLVKYGKTLESDLSRRDFTVNSIAIRLPSKELVDPFGGIADLGRKILRTPIDPKQSFDDDPLRMLRAIRFVSSLGFTIEPETAAAILEMKTRLNIVSKERIRDEFTKLMLSDNPRPGLEAMIDSGVDVYVLPELEALKMQVDPLHHHKDVYEHSLQVLENAISLEPKYLAELNDGKPDLVVRLAALLHDIGKPDTRQFGAKGAVTFRFHETVGAKIARKRLRELRYDKNTVKDVCQLIELHMRFYGYGDAKWTDSAVRRYVTDAEDQLERLHVLTRSDVTTRNRKKAERLAFAYDDLEKRIAELKELEEFKKIRPDLDGFEIMQLLDIEPGPANGWKIGRAYDFLLQHRIDNGPSSKDDATAVLLKAVAEGLLDNHMSTRKSAHKSNKHPQMDTV